MAERQAINPRITVTTRHLLQQACQERRCSQGEVVEAALLAFLTPVGAGGTEDLLLQRLTTIEEALAGLVALVETVLEHQEAQTKEPVVPIATYKQMYGPLDEAAPAQDTPGLSPPPRRPGRLRRWFLREDQA